MNFSEELDVGHYNKKLYELPIPGFEMYTIDEQMTLRSYKMPGSPRIIKLKTNHHGSYEYNLWCYDDDGLRVRKTFSPLRLYLCACAKLNPMYTTLQDFECDEEGKPVAVNLKTRRPLSRKPGNIITSTAYKNSMTDKEKQQHRAARQITELLALQKAVATGDYSEVMEMLWSYRELVIAVMWVRFRCRRERAEECFSVAVEYCVNRFKKDCWVTSNFMGFIIRTTTLALVNKA